MNNQGIAISEIGAAWADYTFGEARGYFDKYDQIVIGILSKTLVKNPEKAFHSHIC